MSIVDDIRAALTAHSDDPIVACLMHPDTRDKLVEHVGRTVAEHTVAIYGAVEIVCDITLGRGVVEPLTRAEFAAWRAHHVEPQKDPT